MIKRIVLLSAIILALGINYAWPRDAGYFKRVGVSSGHRGHRLQLRHMKAMERKAALLGWSSIISDTTSNTHSANNFIKAGYRLYEPEQPWAFAHSLYWIKTLS